MEFQTLTKNLRTLGYIVREFDHGSEAADYLKNELAGKSVGIGGSGTAQQLKLNEVLSPVCQVIWHMAPAEGMTAAQCRAAASRADVYITSVNGVAETGELINIDNTGNRVGASLFGHETVYLIIGENKVASDYAALWRARNVASPLNAQRLGRKTPCADKADRCYNCKSPDRICRALTVFWEKPVGCNYEVLLIHENLGY